jgi:hypothetical protein
MDVLGFAWNRLWTPLDGHSAMVLIFGSIFLLLVVVGLYQDCKQDQMSRYSSTFSHWPRFDIVSHKSNLSLSLSLSPFGMLLNKAIRNVDYGFSLRPHALRSLATMVADFMTEGRSTDTRHQVITPYDDCEFKTWIHTTGFDRSIIRIVANVTVLLI